MRVALFTDADVFAGTERHMLDLARALKQEGVEPTIACPAGTPLAKRAAAQGIPVVSIEKRGLVDFAAIRTLRRLFNSGQMDLVHAHNGRTRLSASIAARLARNGKCVATQHFLQPNHATQGGLKGLIGRLAHRWVNAGVSRFIAISKATAAGILERHEAPPENVSVVLNGIVPPTAESLRTPEEVREELGVAPGAPLVVCVARLEPEKDIATLVDAMRQVLAKVPSAMCWVAGEGSLGHELATHIDRLGLGQSVKLLGFREDALSLIHAGDVFVLPSLAEPFGLVLVEAMALSKPVVATRAGGPVEIVEHEKTGLLVQPSDAEAMAQAILGLLADPARREAMGREGHNRFAEKFCAEVMARGTHAAYRKALAASEAMPAGEALAVEHGILATDRNTDAH